MLGLNQALFHQNLRFLQEQDCCLSLVISPEYTESQVYDSDCPFEACEKRKYQVVETVLLILAR